VGFLRGLFSAETSIAGQDWRRDRDPARSGRAVKEYLETLDDTAWGAASDVIPKFVSPSDPAAQWTGTHKGPATLANAASLSLAFPLFSVARSVGIMAFSKNEHERSRS
jgi:hypothetical protein